LNGKGSAPRPIPDKGQFDKNFEVIWTPKPKPKCKASMMREMRERRKSNGLEMLTLWVTEQEKTMVNAFLLNQRILTKE
tara:strand:+ start:567 stop:803 length:237 start_codon:yes stop_codon:yes gene_type:complete